MNLTAEQYWAEQAGRLSAELDRLRAEIDQLKNERVGITAYVDALAELDRLQATVTRRGELLGWALAVNPPNERPYGLPRELRAAITAELAEGEDGG